MDRWIRRSLERLFRDRIFVSNATSHSHAVGLIRSLRPVGVPDGLRRFGPAGDGGYLMPDDLAGVVACISPGVSSECGFDEAIASRGIDVLLAGASVSAPPAQHPRFRFVPMFLDVSSSAQTLTSTNCVAKSNPTAISFCKWTRRCGVSRAVQHER